MYSHQSWTDGQNYTFTVMEEDKEGLVYDTYVCLHTGINSQTNNVRIYGYVRDLSTLQKITIWVKETIIE